MLIEIGGEHKSGDIHKDQRLQMQDPKVMQMVRENVLSTHHIKDNLLRGKVDKLGHSLDLAWSIKKRLSTEITNSEIDNVYKLAIDSGASGGKLLGAGGAGFMLVYVEAANYAHVLKALKARGLKTMRVNLDMRGCVRGR